MPGQLDEIGKVKEIKVQLKLKCVKNRVTRRDLANTVVEEREFKDHGGSQTDKRGQFIDC